jgi:hypothetical protein
MWGLVVGSNIPDGMENVDPNQTDNELYSAIAKATAESGSYYTAVDESQAVRHYPTRPFITVREPALASISAWVGGPRNLRVVYGVLFAFATILLIRSFERVSPSRATWWCACAVAILLVAPLHVVHKDPYHDAWAGLLLLTSWGLGALGRWRLAIIAALGAVLFRELALPFLIVMMTFDIRARRWHRVTAWATALAAFAAYFTLHAYNVHRFVQPSSTTSPGWLTLDGWPFFVDTVRGTSMLGVLPMWVAAVVVPLALLGWASIATEASDRLLVMLAVFAVIFGIAGRPENTYWGQLYVLLLLPGIAFSPGALLGLWSSVRGQTVSSDPERRNT